MSDKEQRDRLRRIANRAIYNCFSGKGDAKEGKIAQETLAEICKVNSRVDASGLDGLVEMAIHEGMRRVYLEVGNCIMLGAQQGVDDGFSTIADSEKDDKDGWTDVYEPSASPDGT